MRRALARYTVVATALLLCLDALVVAKPQTLIVASWRGVPASAKFGENVDLVLRIESAADAPQVVVTILPTDGVTLTRGELRWSGALRKAQVLELPFTMQVVADGDWTLGASITNKRADNDQVSGAVLRIRARRGIATLTTDAPPSPQ